VSTVRVRWLTSITDIDATAWNAIVGRNRLICRHEYQRAVEASRINDCRYFYPVLYEGNRILAHTCVYFISTELDAFASGALKRAIDTVRRVWTNFLIMRSVECGTPVALGSTISFAEGVDRAAALETIVRETEALAKRLGVRAVLFRDFCEEELGLFDRLRSMGYASLQNLPAARLTIRWRSFDQYVAAMRKNYRHKILAQRRKFAKPDVSVEVLKDFSSHAGDLRRLWENAYDHATEYKRERLTEPFFVSMDRCLGHRSALILARVKGRPVGFSLLLFDDETLIPLFCGLDYAFNNEYALYFNLLYEVVNVGIQEQVRDIDFGITTIAPKLDLGAVAVPLHMYMKHLAPLGRRVVPCLFRMMTPSNPLHSRNVFKR
jgi:predicted N-acyltransferase